MLCLLVILNILFGLALEAYGASQGWRWAEPLVGAITFAHLLYHFLRPPEIGGARVQKKTLFVCLGLATFGELILSAVFELYSYRESVLPFFVPAGHVLLFLAGLQLASLHSIDHWAPRLVPALAGPLVFWNLVQGQDFLSLPLFVLFALCMWKGRDRSLYAVMFVLALLLEFYGTALATWTWAPTVPRTMWLSANPPLAAGTFYSVLDLLVQAITRQFDRPSSEIDEVVHVQESSASIDHRPA